MSYKTTERESTLLNSQSRVYYFSPSESEELLQFLFALGYDRHMLARNVLRSKIVNCLPARGHKTWRTTSHITRWPAESRPDSVAGSVVSRWAMEMVVALIHILGVVLTQLLLWLFDWLRVKQLNFRLAPPSAGLRSRKLGVREAPCSHACNYACLRQREGVPWC